MHASAQVLWVLSGVGMHWSGCIKIGLTPQSHIHNMFHVMFLKKFTGEPPTTVLPLPLIKHGRVLMQPEKVMHTRLQHGVWKILVKMTCQVTTDVS
jgi:hypothetical protein